MPRFKVNRWWILILTLSLGFALVAFTSTNATASARITDELGRSGGAPPPGDGDPDIPVSSAKRARPGAVGQPTAGLSTRRAAGDGASVDSAMMWNFRIVLQSLRLWTFGRF
jgi:hypothetical protein